MAAPITPAAHGGVIESLNPGVRSKRRPAVSWVSILDGGPDQVKSAAVYMCCAGPRTLLPNLWQCSRSDSAADRIPALFLAPAGRTDLARWGGARQTGGVHGPGFRCRQGYPSGRDKKKKKPYGRGPVLPALHGQFPDWLSGAAPAPPGPQSVRRLTPALVWSLPGESNRYHTYLPQANPATPSPRLPSVRRMKLPSPPSASRTANSIKCCVSANITHRRASFPDHGVET